MPNFTKHGKRRMKQRCGAGGKTATTLARRAYAEGITHAEARGELKKWMDKEYLIHGSNNCRFYANKLYIFIKRGELLITVLDAPLHIEQNLKRYVDTKVYLTYKRNRVKRKNNPELRKQYIADVEDIIREDIISFLKNNNINFDFMYIDESFKAVFYTTKKLRETTEMQNQIDEYINDKYGLKSRFERNKNGLVA